MTQDDPSWRRPSDRPPPPPAPMPPDLRRKVRRGLIGGGAVVAALLALLSGKWVYDEFFNYGSDEIPVITSQPKVEPERPIVQTDLQKAESAFGPFKVLPPAATEHPDTHNPAVLELLHDGRVAASTKYTVPFDAQTWKPGTLTQINALTVDPDGDYAQIRSATGKVYTVRCNQPLLFAERPQQIVLIDSTGQQWAVATDRAQLMRQPLEK